MAFDLTAIFRVNDQGSSQLSRIFRNMDQLNRSMSHITRSTSAVTIGLGNVTNSIGRQANELTGLKSQIVGVAGAYVGAQGAIKAFNSTIGAAAQYEASEVAVKAIFNDDKASSEYLSMVNKMAVDSPLLNSKDMLSNSKGLIAMTKNVSELGDAWSIVERLQVLDPTQGTSGASFSLKEMLQGDSLSMFERFGLNKTELNRIKKLDIPTQLSEINKLLDGMGITQATVDAMGQTTLGYWAQIGERTESFMRTIGKMGNSKIGDVLGGIVKKIDSLDPDALAVKIDAAIGGGIQKVINFTKSLWSMKEMIASAAVGVGTFVAAIASVVVVTKTIMSVGSAFAFVLSPIGLIAGAITGLVFGFMKLYESSEGFRDSVSNASSRVSDLFKSFKSSDTFDHLKDSAASIADTISTLLAPAIQSVTTYLAGIDIQAVTAGFNDAIDSATDFINKIINGIPAAISVIAGITAALVTFKAAMTGMLIVGTVTRLIEAYRLGTLTATLATLGFNTALFANPIGLIIAGVAALIGIITVLALNWDTVKAKTIAVWDAIGGLKGGISLILGPIGFLINAGIDLAKNWDSTKSVWENVWSSIQRSAATSVNAVIGLINEMIVTINKIPGVNIPIVAKVDWGQATSPADFRKIDGSHYNGIGRIPYNGYLAETHVGERILTRFEADKYDAVMRGEMKIPGVSDIKYEPVNVNNTTINQSTTNNNGNNATPTQGSTSISIAKLADSIVVREEADIRKIADQLVLGILEKRGVV